MKSLSSLTEKEILDLVDNGLAEFRRCEFHTPLYSTRCARIKCRNIDTGDIVIYSYSPRPREPYRVGTFNRYGGVGLPIYNLHRLDDLQYQANTTCSLFKLITLMDENDMEFYT